MFSDNLEDSVDVKSTKEKTKAKSTKSKEGSKKQENKYKARRKHKKKNVSADKCQVDKSIRQNYLSTDNNNGNVPDVLLFTRETSAEQMHGYGCNSSYDYIKRSTTEVGSNENAIARQAILSSISNHSFSLTNEVSPVSDIALKSGACSQNTSADYKKRSYAGVYWDMHSCPVPEMKSASDIVKKIRKEFCIHCTEAEFIVLCDIQNITAQIARELYDNKVTLEYIDCHKNNTIDQRLGIHLRKFGNNYKHPESLVVVISGDCNFDSDFYELRYLHRIKVFVLHNIQVQRNLKSIVSYAQLFKMFCNDLPDFKIYKPTFAADDGFLCNDKCTVQKIYLDDPDIESSITSQNTNTVLSEKVSNRNCDKIARESHTLNQPKQKNVTNSRQSNVAGNLPKVKEKVISEQHNLFDEVYMALHVSKCESKMFWTGFLENILPNIKFLVKKLYQEDKLLILGFESKDDALMASELIHQERIHNKTVPKEVDIYSSSETPYLQKNKSGVYQQGIGSNNGSSDYKGQSIHPKSNKKIIDDCCHLLSSKMKLLLKSHKKKMDELCEEKASLSCFTDVDRCESKELEFEYKKAIVNRLRTLKEQMNDFSNYISNKQKELKAYCTNLPVNNCMSAIEKVKRDFEIECDCFESCHPAYTKKSSIIEVLNSYNVCAVNMKDTSHNNLQICSYLLQGGLASSGEIVYVHPGNKINQITSENEDGCILDPIAKKLALHIIRKTDYSFLKDCLQKSGLGNIKYVVIDNVQERYFYMDILLSVLKYYVSNGKCKVVIVGTDVTSIKNFFKVKKEATVKIAEYLYPIHIVWKEASVDIGYNYVQECVGHVVNICRAEGSIGNIAVFLTSMLDIQGAVDLLNHILSTDELEKLQLIHLHEMQTHKQRLISYKKEARKIIFTTDYGRLSELMPHVHYVIDCGFVLEESYNITTFCNELSVKFQSKNMAEWRKNCAGRMYPGVCYRLYSENDFQKKMSDNTPVQIHQKDLSHIYLLLLKAGINPLQFNFCEKPSTVRSNRFLEKLAQMEAVQNNKLTELGSKLAEMNLNIDVANLVIHGFNEGLFVEAAVVAAMYIISGYLSFQHCSDKEILPSSFMQTNGDFETVNEIYKEWLQVPKQCKNDWLNANYINCETMIVTHELVTSITNTASRLIGGKRLKRSSDWSDRLQLLLVKTFPYNLAVYSGYQHCGYQNPYNSSPLFFHSLSPLNHSGVLPEFVVYQTLLKSSCNFIVGISRIKKTLLEEMEKSGIPRVQLSEYKKKMLVPVVLQPLGKVLFKRLIGKKGRRLELLKQDIKAVTDSDFSEIKVSAPKSQITIHANCQNSDVATQYVLDLINEEKNKMLNYEVDVPFDGWNSGSIRMVMGSGGEIKNILLQECSCDVFVKSNLPDEELVKKLSVYGEVTNCIVGEQGITIRYKAIESAERAINEFHNRSNFELYGNTKLGSLFRRASPCHVTVSFVQKRCLKTGYIKFKSESDLQETLSRVKGMPVRVAGEKIKFKINKEVKNSLLLSELPQKASEVDIFSAMFSKLPVYITAEDIIINHEKLISLSEEEMEDLAESFRHICSLYTNIDKFTVEISKHSDDSLVGEATLMFENIQDAHITALVLREVLVSGYEAKLNLSFSIVCSLKLFSSVKNQVQDSLKLFTSGERQDDVLKISAKPNGNSVTVVADTNNIGDLEKVRKKFEEAFTGVCISGLDFTQMEEIASDGGMELIKNLEANLHLCILVDYLKNIISISGEIQACTAAQKVIDNYLKALKSTSKQFELTGESVPKGLLNYLIKKYGYSFAELRTSCRLASLELKFEERLLIAYGSHGIIELEKLWKELCREVENRNMLKGAVENECSICLGHADENSFCLSYCGHIFCKQCLMMQVKCAVLPLICQKEGCRRRIVWEDLKALVSGEESLTIHHLQMSALRKFLCENSDKYRLCPMVGCYAVYKIPENQKIFICPCCENDVCTSCNVIYHHGMSCDMFWSISGKSETVKAWMNEEAKKRKICSKCKCGVENNGKNSFTACWKCRKFMCWSCSKLFPKLQAVENHCRTCIFSRNF